MSEMIFITLAIRIRQTAGVKLLPNNYQIDRKSPKNSKKEKVTAAVVAAVAREIN